MLSALWVFQVRVTHVLCSKTLGSLVPGYAVCPRSTIHGLYRKRAGTDRGVTP